MASLAFIAACSRGAADDAGGDAPVATASHPSPPAPLRAVVASVNDALGVPSFVWLAGGHRAADVTRAPADVARDTVHALATQYHLSEDNVRDTVTLRDEHAVGDGAVVVRFAQKVRDVDVFRAGINVALSKEHAPVAATGSLSPHVTPKDGGRFARDARMSIASAVSKSLSRAVDASELQPQAQAGNADQGAGYVHYTYASTVAARAKRVWFPTSTGLVAAHYVEVDNTASPADEGGLVGFVVSAASGAVLFENSMSAADSFAYRVWTDVASKTPLPSPYGAGAWPYRGTGAPAFVAPSLVSLESFPFSKNDPWLAAGATTTTGNNVDAYADLAETDGFGPGDVRASVTAAGTFDRTFAPTGAPAASADAQQAIVTNLFYVVNYMHDLFYDAGFDEKAGNAQASNYGRGGKEGDPIRAEAQDFSGRNNANMSTPADGASPRMQMYVFTGTPARDGALDATVVAHEWGHYLSNRLVGDGSGLTTNQSRGLGEGWGDFVALLALSRAEDAAVPANAGWRGAFAIGGYADGGHYFGMRRYPYSTDMSKNPLTFKHIQDGQRLPTTAPLAFGASGANNSETHNTGEVWATMLWECFTALLRDPRYTHAQAAERMRRYLVASLQLTPPDPTLIDARDAVLAAAYATDQRDFELFAAAFAKRGAGLRARAPHPLAVGNAGVVESMITGNDLELISIAVDDSVSSCDADGVLDAGEEGRVTITVRNSGVGTLSAIRGRVTSTASSLAFAGGGSITFPALKPFETASVSVGVSLGASSALLPLPLTITLSDPSLGGAAGARDVTATFLGVGNRDDRAAASATDNAEAKVTAWTMSGDAALGASSPWTILADGQSPPNHVFYMPANEAISDQYLVSPVLRVGTAAALKVSFRQRYVFESSEGKNYDGGVVEISTDDGATWSDVGAPLYGGTIDPGTTETPSSNPLKTRRAVVGRSPGFPGFSSATLDLGRAYAGQSVRLRFRVGTDEGTGLHGWELDDLAFSGITNTPFASQVVDTCTR